MPDLGTCDSVAENFAEVAALSGATSVECGMVCVGGLLVRDGRVLLGLRSASRVHHPDVWDLFGGHAEHGECALRALRRELDEEIGVTVTAASLLQVVPYSGAAESYEYRIYVITAWEGVPANRQPEEHDRIAWFSPNELDPLRLAHPAYLELICGALAAAPPPHERCDSDAELHNTHQKCFGTPVCLGTM